MSVAVAQMERPGRLSAELGGAQLLRRLRLEPDDIAIHPHTHRARNGG